MCVSAAWQLAVAPALKFEESVVTKKEEENMYGPQSSASLCCGEYGSRIAGVESFSEVAVVSGSQFLGVNYI